jgi:hypothetical protein
VRNKKKESLHNIVCWVLLSENGWSSGVGGVLDWVWGFEFDGFE